MDAELAQVIEHGVAAEELERAKTRLIADAVYAQDSQSTLARWYGVALTTGSKVEDVSRLARSHPRGQRQRGTGSGAQLARQGAVR